VFSVVYTESYVKKAKKFIKHHPELLSQYEKTLKLLEINPLHPSLRLHKLKGKLKHLWSISINLNYRISLEFFIEKEKIILVNIGSHSDVYS